MNEMNYQPKPLGFLTENDSNKEEWMGKIFEITKVSHIHNVFAVINFDCETFVKSFFLTGKESMTDRKGFSFLMTIFLSKEQVLVKLVI